MASLAVLRLQYFSIVGYSRSKMSDEEFRDLISENLTCRVTAGEDCGREMEEYLARCSYVAVSSAPVCGLPGCRGKLHMLTGRSAE